MSLLLQNIDKLNEPNIAGGWRIDLLDIFDVQSVPAEVNGNVPSSVVPKSGANFLTITPTRHTLFFKETPQMTPGGLVYDGVAEFTVPKHRIDLVRPLARLAETRVVSIFHCLNVEGTDENTNTMLLLGNQKQPAKAFLIGAGTGADPATDRSEMTVQVRWRRKQPTPFYQGTPPEPLDLAGCPTLSELWMTASNEERQGLISAMLGGDIWAIMDDTQRTAALAALTGTELWPLLDSTQQADVLTAAGVSTLDIVDDAEPYDSYLIDFE